MLRAASVALLCMAFHSVAGAADLPQRMPLTDSQLDAISAGMFAAADGTGRAEGNSSGTQVTLKSMVAPDGQMDGMANGQVTASATSIAGLNARASATLSLFLVIP